MTHTLSMSVKEYEELSFDFKTSYAYILCYIHCKSMQKFCDSLKRRGWRVEDDDLENWFKRKHYGKWKKKCGNDWRGLAKLLIQGKL